VFRILEKGEGGRGSQGAGDCGNAILLRGEDKVLGTLWGCEIHEKREKKTLNNVYLGGKGKKTANQKKRWFTPAASRKEACHEVAH